MLTDQEIDALVNVWFNEDPSRKYVNGDAIAYFRVRMRAVLDANRAKPEARTQRTITRLTKQVEDLKKSRDYWQQMAADRAKSEPGQALEDAAKEAEHWQTISTTPGHACGQYIAGAIRGLWTQEPTE